MNMQDSKGWPKDVEYLRDYEFNEEASGHELRGKIKSSLHEAYETIQGITNENPNVSCEIQIVMVNNKNPGKNKN